MKGVLVKVLVTAAALWAASVVVDGVDVQGGSTQDRVVTVLVVALLFGVVNAVIKPVVRLLALPLFVLTLGLVTFVINALMLLLTSALADGLGLAFRVDGFGAALLGALVVSLVSWGLSLVARD